MSQKSSQVVSKKPWFRKIIELPVSFRTVFPPLWIAIMIILVGADLMSKKLVTDHLNFRLGIHQAEYRMGGVGSAERDGVQQINLLGKDGSILKLRLVFNDRFVFGSGPSAPVLGIFLTLFAIVFLFFYRWHNHDVGHPAAWLLVFSGAFGNFIDKLFVKSLETREWFFNLGPEPGNVSGVVDFIEAVWFGWDRFADVPILSFLAWPSWPTFNLADSYIVVGILLLLLSMKEKKEEAENVE